MPARKAARASRPRARTSGRGQPVRSSASRPAPVRAAGGRFAPKAKPDKPQEFFRGAKLMRPDDDLVDDETFSEIKHPKRRLFLQALSRTPRIGVACRAAGISAATSWHWRKDHTDPAFQEALEVAIKLGVERAEGELWRRGIDGVEKPVYQQGRLVGTVQEYDTTAAIFMLKGADPDKYRDNVDHRHVGPGGGPILHQHALADVPDDEVERRYREAMQVVRTHRSLPAPILDVAPEPQKTPEASAYAAELAKRNGNNGNSGSNGGGSV